ncbi:C25 family cysteine peptidase [Belliella kenyensis]|uniref:C25 family cysteine peptidase n=1 Tax=Belliella kenyensis TaxID=1472724 RepID=A0ABV8EG00_9BACT|nr:C25 family cysteine peptidase [Belliella kenyensis]MCH7401007.1 C25 family cysteine peptidase [Belliella kenyensis]MDN3604005.1 C25 family cysteine peptidase [Belliella kenyensis]
MGQTNWIDYGQTYYRIPTVEDGLHRLSFTTLSASGIAPSTIDPRNIRIFHRGEEVAIHIEGEQDGRFDQHDFITFFGKRNDGTLDAKLYTDPSHVGNTLYNTHNDTTAYFLTISPSIRGKRMLTNAIADANSVRLDSYHSESTQIFSDQYNLSFSYFPGTRLSEFEEGQGWMSAPVVKGTPRNITFSNLGTVPDGMNATLHMGLTGRSETPHSTILRAGANASSLRIIGTYTYQNYQAIHIEASLQSSDFNSDGSIVVQLQSNGSTNTDNTSIAYAKLTFPKQLVNRDINKEWIITQGQEGVLEWSGLVSNYVAHDLTDPNNPIKIPLVPSERRIRMKVGEAGEVRRVLMENTQNIRDINVMRPVRFRNFLTQAADFIIVTHPVLRRPSASYGDPVLAYAAHRASALGGGYDTLVINIDELYDQFSYGEKTPLAIYEFLRAYYPIHKPDNLLLMGRSNGIFSTARENNINQFYRKRPSIFQFQDLIPPAGYPYADNNFSIGLDPAHPHVSAVAVGRIPARNSDQVAAYLEKIKEKDALGASEPWQKEIIHLSGGVSAFELERFFNFLNGFKTIAEGPYLGANVTTFRKRSNSTVELIDVSGDVNKGLSLITFFGHGAPTVLDIEIGFASDPTMAFNNRGKYPMLLLNGCDAGNAFGNAYTFGEDWVLTPSKGATNFMAHANIGVDIYLRRYSESFYTTAFADSSMIHQPIGKIRMETEKLFYSRFGTSEVNRSHAEQLVMLGDPAVRMFPANKPDYALQADEVILDSFENEPFNALADSLRLSTVVRNLGRVDFDSIILSVTRRLPDGSLITYPSRKIAPISRKDTIHFIIPNTGLAAFGDNLFSIELNRNRDVAEMTYANNSISVSKFIPMSGTMNLLPFNFGIVNNSKVELIAQIPGKAVEERTVIIQLDTAADFSSARRREQRVTTSSITTWEVDLFGNIAARDSVTFYWRSRFLNPRAGESDEWVQSSFSYIQAGPEGWTQRTLPQLESNGLVNLEVDRSRKIWKYEDTKLNFGVFTFGVDADSLTFRNTQFYLEGVPQIIDNALNANSRLCPNGSLGLVAFEKRSLTPYLVIPIPGFDILDGRSCGRVPQVIQSIRNSWLSDPNQNILREYIDGLAEGDYVTIFSVGSVNYEQWQEVVFEKLKEVGANEALLRNLKNGEPYILHGRKGMRPGEAVEIVGKKDIEVSPDQQIIEFESDVVGYFTSGSIITPRIGPSADWKRFFKDVKTRDWIDEEKTVFDVIGVRDNGEETILFQNVRENQLDLSSVNTTQFPYLRLRYAMNDELSTAPAQLNRWQVNYTGVPEGVLIFNGREQKLNLQEGQDAVLNFEFANVSKYDFLDSLLVQVNLYNSTTRNTEERVFKIPPVKSGESHAFALDFESAGRGGSISIEVNVNPRIIMEQTFRNNLIDLPDYIQVTPDNTNAILDVSFDGTYIMDGDIVSPTVLINTLLRNEKTLLLKKDTLGIELFLKKQCDGCQFERVNFSSPKVNWTAATENSSFSIGLLPGPLEDGIYTFRVVTEELGVDKPFEVSFEVINESTITNFYPYPNPFSTSTRFVFTVTGSEVPDQIKIQIMTVTGRVVREILQDELGNIRIGNNITDFAWDGRDEFGDQLANGVYIYRVLVRKEGQFIEPRATAGDRGFKQGYGKMYLLR